MLVPGEPYPTTWQEFESWFAIEQRCRAFLEHVRWPDGFVCPKCSRAGGWRTSRGLWMCGACGHQGSVTAGTIFQRSRLPLRSWFSAVWFVCAQKNGVSALGLQRVLGLGSYETARAWLRSRTEHWPTGCTVWRVLHYGPGEPTREALTACATWCRETVDAVRCPNGHLSTSTRITVLPGRRGRLALS
jgi:hypothetical protein